MKPPRATRRPDGGLPSRREFRWIRWIRRRCRHRRPDVLTGIGDDAAVLAPREGLDTVLTTDTLVEGVHFRRSWFRPAELGGKAAVISLSDLAAMAADPVAMLLSLEVPPDLSEADFRAVCGGVADVAGRYRAQVAGGNISRSPSVLSITTTLAGRVSHGSAVPRDGARAGDGIWITGDPAGAGVGLRALTRWGRGRIPRGFHGPLGRFLRPEARIREARYLAERASIHALIDVSDGILGDLAHILEASNVGADIEIPPPMLGGRLPALCASLRIDPLDAVLTHGESYELLFTARPTAVEGLVRDFRRRFRLPLHRIGTIRRRRGIRLRKPGGKRWEVAAGGFDHLTELAPTPSRFFRGRG